MVWEPGARDGAVARPSGGWDEILFVAGAHRHLRRLLAVANRRASKNRTGQARRRAPPATVRPASPPRVAAVPPGQHRQRDRRPRTPPTGSLSVPRDDVVGEGADGDGWAGTCSTTVPFDAYERGVTRSTGTEGRYRVPAVRLPPAGGHLAVPHEPPDPPALRRRPPDGRLPWWYPPQRPDARTASVLGLLATLSIVVGYHGTLLTQTMTFAADEFGAGRPPRVRLAAVRVGGLCWPSRSAPSPTAGAGAGCWWCRCWPHRVHGGRRPLPTWRAGRHPGRQPGRVAAAACCWLVAAEEMPTGARAYALSPAGR